MIQLLPGISKQKTGGLEEPLVPQFFFLFWLLCQTLVKTTGPWLKLYAFTDFRDPWLPRPPQLCVSEKQGNHVWGRLALSLDLFNHWAETVGSWGKCWDNTPCGHQGCSVSPQESSAFFALVLNITKEKWGRGMRPIPGMIPDFLNCRLGGNIHPKHTDTHPSHRHTLYTHLPHTQRHIIHTDTHTTHTHHTHRHIQTHTMYRHTQTHTPHTQTYTDTHNVQTDTHTTHTDTHTE